MKIAVVGATGLVGREMLKVLEEQGIEVNELLPVASEKSIGTEVDFAGKKWKVISVQDAIAARPEFALFSAGGGPSKELAPLFAAAGTVVIDNSSAWRMDPDVPLVVPEINAHAIGDAKIIANPNCSTIQMVMALAPLHRHTGIKRIVVSTYQSVSGTGKNAVEQLMRERRGEDGPMVYPHQIDLNCLPQVDVFLENDYTREEMKMVNETRKILDAPEIKITATCVRVPVTSSHSESVNVEFNAPLGVAEARSLMAAMPGVVVMDDPGKGIYPMPYLSAGRDEVFVGRVRLDDSQPNTLNFWIVSDNLRKGAATNAVQILKAVIASRQLA